MVTEDRPSSSLTNDQPTAAVTTVAIRENRAEMVQTALQFLQNPRVQGTPVGDQKKFLRSKGLTEAEIEEAFKTLPPVPQQTMGNYPQQQNFVSQTASSGSRILAACQSAVLISGATYMAYKLVRSWILPKFFDIPDPAQEQIESLQTQVSDLQNSSKFIMDSVVQTLETVSTQQEQLNRAIMLLSTGGTKGFQLTGNEIDKLHSEIGIVKSLLLNQNQFPPLPDQSAMMKHGRMNGFVKNSPHNPDKPVANSISSSGNE